MKHKTARFLIVLLCAVVIVMTTISLGSAAQTSEDFSLARSAPHSFLANSGQPSDSWIFTDEFGRYRLSVPLEWEVTTNKRWDNTDARKFDALVGFTAPDEEVVTLRTWNGVTTGAQESLYLYLIPFLPSETAVSQGTLRGNAVFMATRSGVPGQSPSSVLAFLQCQERAFRFEYISVAGGSQLAEFFKLLKSFRCSADEAELAYEATQTMLPDVAREELIAAPTAPHANPCQGYWDPNDNQFTCGQCTWWANYSRPDIPSSSEEWNGDAYLWDNNALVDPGNFAVSTTPEQGAIAVWEANSNGALEAGHVAYVTGVNGDGTFNVTEMNWGSPNSLRSRANILDSPNINFILGGVTFFEHINFGGRWYRLRASEPDLTFGGLEPSSIFIPAGWDTIFYRDRNYGTAAWKHRWGTTTLSALESSLWNLALDPFSDGSNMNDNVRSVRMSRNSCLQQPSSPSRGNSVDEGCGDVPPDDNDTTPPSATGFSASVTEGRRAEITTSGIQDNSGGSGVREVRFSAKWGGNWYGIGTDGSAPYTLSWDMCSSNVPDGDVELGMEVWDNANNFWVWSNNHGNPHITKDSACGGSGDPGAGGTWHANFWMNKGLAGYVNWDVYYLWDDGRWPYIWFDWGINGPKEGWSGDEFSLRIWRNVYFPGGRYEFRTDGDDGVRVFVDGRIVVDHWWAGSAGDVIDISAGEHEVKVEYFEDTGNAKLSVEWYGPGYPQPDRANPNGRISLPTNLSAVNSSPITIWAEAWDDVSGVDYVRFMAHYCQGGECGWRELGTDSSAPYSHTWNWDSIGEQHVWLAIHVADKSGKVTYDPGGWVEVDLDRTNPMVEITAPTEGSYLTDNTVPIVTWVSDSGSGISSVQFFAGYNDNSGNYWHELGSDTDGGNGWQWDWNASSAADQRDVSFFVYVYDRAGNLNSSARWANILDRTAPTSQVDALPANSPPSFTVSWSGSDNAAGLASYDVQYQQDGGSWQNWLTYTSETSSTFTGDNGHTYGFRNRARDLAGHVEAWPASADAITTVEEQDLEPPIVNWVAPVGNGETHTVNGETVTLKVTATDNVGVEVVEFWRWNHTTQEFVFIGFDNSAPYTAQVNTSEFTNDWNYTYAHAIDGSGNMSGDAYIWLFYESKAGSTPPPPQNLSASDGTLISQVRITWTQSEGATYYELYRSEPGSPDKVYMHTREGQYDFTDDNNGDGTVLEYALKACSDMGCSEFSNFDTGYADMPIMNPVDNPEGDGAFTVSWVAANTANGYRLGEQKDYGNWTNIYWGNLTSQTVSGKEEGTWCYRVSAHSGIQGDSPWTEPKCTYVGTEVDTVPPAIEWGWPVGNGMTFNATNEEVFLEVEATDNRSVTVVQFSWLDETTNVWQTFAEDTVAPYQHLLDISILPVGCTKVDAMAFDAAGNANSEYIWICAGTEPSWKTFVPTILR